MKVLGIDQSYTCSGIACAEDGVVTECYAHKYVSKTKRGKRREIRKIVRARRDGLDMVVVERVRLFSGGFISIKSIVGLASLVMTISDAAGKIPVYSADTRAWKSKVLGSAKATKEDAVEFVKTLGYVVNDDAADAACLALYAFNRQANLKRED